MTSVIQAVVNKALTENFRGAMFYSPVEKALHNCVSEPLSIGAVAIGLVDALSLTIPVAKFFKHEVEIEEMFVKLAEAVQEKRIKIEGCIPTKS